MLNTLLFYAQWTRSCRQLINDSDCEQNIEAWDRSIGPADPIRHYKRTASCDRDFRSNHYISLSPSAARGIMLVVELYKNVSLQFVKKKEKKSKAGNCESSIIKLYISQLKRIHQYHLKTIVGLSKGETMLNCWIVYYWSIELKDFSTKNVLSWAHLNILFTDFKSDGKL